ncbi:DUF421 domain-containing protein [Roseibium sp.]|uniref:DUF421 domain-containing protein n=1 Tax=Roseibium sp. TaxID=1936156 RepID=UPI003A97628D
MAEPIWFDGFDDLIRIAIRVPMLYFAIIAFIRIAGKRSMAQMNNFDWIVTVALGSMVASGALLKDVTVAETLFAVAAFLALQFALTAITCRSERFAAWIKPSPRTLARHGRFDDGAMRRERVTSEEIRSALRQQGLDDISMTEEVILETDATVSVIPRRDHRQV